MTAEDVTPETGEETPEPETPEPAKSRSDDVRRMDAALRKANKEAETLRRTLKEREDAELSETERLRAQLADRDRSSADLQAKLQKVLNERAVERHAVRLKIVDPEAAVLLIDMAELEYDEDGKPKDKSVEAALKALIERKPYLAEKRGSGSADGGPRGQGPPPQSMNDWMRGVATGAQR